MLSYLKSLVPFKKDIKKILKRMFKRFEFRPPLSLPPGTTEEQLKTFLLSIEIEGAPPQEVQNYCESDFRRFLYTFGLFQDLKTSGKCLELGANPYFLTLLLKQFSPLELTLGNYFGDHPHLKSGFNRQNYGYQDFKTGEKKLDHFDFYHFNVEKDFFPFPDREFDVVVFCEIIEHLIVNPLAALSEVKRVLKSDGYMVFSTPNVARLENVARMLNGTNLYDPYSGYGPYGRHNREYTLHELYRLLDFAGFTLEKAFTADVHPNWAETVKYPASVRNWLWKRRFDLGQYTFILAKNTHEAKKGLPTFLFRSYPEKELHPFEL